ncbi:hypothetical protein J6590_082802 [Homalodisca vitripennis]|nr:hypothetical protein J6590_082802 [Homalodisca vitripennis]
MAGFYTGTCTSAAGEGIPWNLLVYHCKGNSLSWRHLYSMPGPNSGHTRVLRARLLSGTRWSAAASVTVHLGHIPTVAGLNLGHVNTYLNA